MNKKIGFIGCGNMAKAMIKSILLSNLVEPERVIASDGYRPCIEAAQKEYRINIANDNKEVVQFADIIFLAVKPNMYEKVMAEIKNDGKDKLFVSIAPGKTLDFLMDGLGRDAKILRTMPNTPAMVGEGVTAICPNDKITEAEYNDLVKVISSFGIVERIEEKMFDAVVAVSGSSPAYVFMFIEAMADAAVLQGMARDQAYRFASQAVLGSAKMVLETKMHPGALKDMVCSPGGTTIEAVAVLEEKGFRSAVIHGMNIVHEKSGKM